MKWQGRRKSSNIEDRRGQRPQNFGGGGGGINPMMLAPLVKILFSKTGLVIIAAFFLITWLTGTNPLSLLSQFTGGGQVTQSVNYQPSAEEEALAEMTAVVLADTEDVWNQLMEGYREPTLVLFSGQVESACGFASSASGPFYCPGDEKVYIDLSFFSGYG
jgi:predicted metalloprotease